VAIDEHGCEIEDDAAQLIVFRAHGASSQGGTRPLKVESFGLNQNTDPTLAVITCSRLPYFRHSGRTFQLQVINTDKEVVAEFTVPSPHPLAGQWPVWQAEALPATRTDGDVTVTLNSLRATPAASGDAPLAVTLTPDISISQNGQPTADWTIQQWTLTDALGNESSLWSSRLCREESAWRLGLKLFRQPGANFDGSQMFTLPKVRLPASGRVMLIGRPVTLEQIPLEVEYLGGAGQVVTVTPDPLNKSGSTSTSGYTENESYNIEVAYQGGVRTATVDCSLPHLAIRTKAPIENFQLYLRVTDEQQREVKTHFTPAWVEGAYYWFMQPQTDAALLNISIIIDRGREFMFFVAPPE
jgi:hypothetical protein